MRTLPKYIIRQTAITLILTVTVFTFVLLLGGMLRQLSDLLVSGQVGLQAVGLFVVLVLPSVLSFSLPMAMLATALLVFGRLSADHEITAMRASGIGLGQVAAPVILVAALMSGLCFYINASLAPQCKFYFKTMFARLGVERPIALLGEGMYLRDFPGYAIYVGRKDEKAGEIYDIILHVLDDKGQVVSRLWAEKGRVLTKPDEQKLVLDLMNVRGDLRDPKDPTNVRKIRAGTTAQRYPVELDLGRIMKRARQAKKLGDFSLAELLAEVEQLRGRGIYPAAVLLEAHQRVSMAVACVSFALIGIPLGMKTSRRETSIGIALSLALAFSYYFVLILATTLKERPYLFPEAILWSPNLIFQLVGLALLWRISRS